MSIFICTICEENRQAITDAANQAMRSLGAIAKGFNPDLVTTCPTCRSKEKTFQFAAFFDELNWIWTGVVDEAGHYVIRGPEDLLSSDVYNHLNIMNRIKNTLEKDDFKLMKEKLVCKKCQPNNT